MKASLRSAFGSLALAFYLSAPNCYADPAGPDIIIDMPVGRNTINKTKTLGLLRVYLSQNWSVPDPKIVRAVVVIHGLLRNAKGYFHDVEAGKAATDTSDATTLVIAPRFLDPSDTNNIEVLQWTNSSWEGGGAALWKLGSSPITSFHALDDILIQLRNRNLYPNLRDVVVAGHSGGGQLAQRFAMASRQVDSLVQAGIKVRFVVANPSSYAYFGPERPGPIQSCPGWNNWKYGLENRPPYIASLSPLQLEQRYVARRVIYLLGKLDTDPNAPELETSCPAEAQGPSRFTRGLYYVNNLKSRNGGAPNHSLWQVPDVGHSADEMFNSACGRAALFDSLGCVASDAPK